MEDFLKNRPVLDPKSALVLAAEPKPASTPVKPPSGMVTPSAAPGASPFGALRAPAGATQAPAAPKAQAPAVAAELAGAAPQALKGEHGTKVQTVVERGRVTKIIVTCTCGKVTEIACQY